MTTTCMFSPRSEGISSPRRERKQDDMSSGCQRVTVCGRRASCIQVGVGGKQLFVCSAFVVHAHGPRVAASRVVLV